jgi:hypothetical protein
MGSPEEQMKKILTLSAALMLCASMAMAQGVGLYTGLDCNPAATQLVTNPCTGNSGTLFTAMVSCVIPAAGKAQFVGTISVIDVQTSLATIPDWWRMDACRSTGFTMAADGSIASSICTGTIWDAANPAGSNLSAQNGPSPGRERFLLGSVLLPTDVYDLAGDGSTEVLVGKWVVNKNKTLSATGCGGCAQGACIVLNEVQLQGTGDHSYADYSHLTQPIGSHNYITYNSGAPVCAGSTPTQNRTWGSVKALYR